ncbi:MAG: hypothetical protein ACRD1K_18275 [Acidimicrobiales bacterium]
MRRRFVGLIVANAVLLASSSAALAIRLSDNSAARREERAAREEAVAADAASGITVVDAGSKPRRALRLRLAPGTVTSSAIELKLDADLVADGEALNTPVPAVRFVIEHRVGEVQADGSALSFTAATAEATKGFDPAEVAERLRSLEEIYTVTGSGIVEATGRLRGIEFDTSGVTDFGVLQTFLGRTAEVTTTYTLTEVDGDTLELDFDVDLSIDRGPARVPSDEGVVVLERFVTRSRGSAEARLDQAVFARSQAVGTTEARLTITGDDGEQVTLEERIEVEIVVTPA